MDIKKSQQNTKKFIQNFGKQIKSFHNINIEILKLLEALLRTLSTLILIQNHYGNENLEIKLNNNIENSIILNNNNNNKIITQNDLKIIKENKLSLLFPDLHQKIINILMLEREDYCCQLKKLM